MYLYQHNNHVSMFRKYYEKEGNLACEKGIKAIKNPYKCDSKQHDHWYNGWMSYYNKDDLELSDPESNYCGGY